MFRLVDLMLANPFVTVGRVERALPMTNQRARNLIKDATRRGWLHEVGAAGRGGRIYWMAHEVWRISEDESAYSEGR